MDATGIAYLGIGLAAMAAAIAGFFALFGKGPRGSVLTVAACIFVWGAMLPVLLRDPDTGTISRPLDLLTAVLRLSGIVGAIFGIFDLFQSRPACSNSIFSWIIRQPLVWGGAACFAFYSMLTLGEINQPVVVRYFASHPVEYATTALFFVGLSALAIRYVSTVLQSVSMRQFTLEPIPVGGQHVTESEQLLCQLAELPASLQQGYLVRRLRDALEFVRRKNSAESLDDHLRHLEELDVERMYAGYSIVRIVIWAVPILGFLGTVIGITLAIANLSPQALEQSLPEVTSGLGVAFDTTALALTLSIILMFGKFWVERAEERLLTAVDVRVSQELVGRFPGLDLESDPNVAAIRRMSEQVLEGVEALASRQAEVWKSTIDETHQQWAEVSLAAGKIVKDSLSAALAGTLDHHAKTLDDNLGRQTKVLGLEISRQAERLAASTERLTENLTASTAQLTENLGATTTQHADRLAASTTEHAERLSADTTQHAERLVASTTQYAERLTASTTEHVDRLTTGTAEHVNRLATGTAQHADKLERSALHTTARLRDGLERLAELLVEALSRHGEVLTASEQGLAEENRRHLSEVEAALGEAMVVAADRQEQLIRQSENLLREMQGALVEASDATVRQQEQMVRQGDVLLQVVGATGQVKKLEDSLNQNLDALRQAHNFEDVVLSLSAAIQLLNARLGSLPASVSSNDTASGPPASQAA